MTTVWHRFEADEPPFSLDFPADWRVDATEDVLGLASPIDDVAVTLTRMRSPDGDVTPASVKLIFDAFSEGRPLRAEPRWIASAEWNGLEAEFGPAAHEQPLSHWLFRVVSNDRRAYAITATGPRDEVERHRQTCLQIMSSLRFRL